MITLRSIGLAAALTIGLIADAVAGPYPEQLIKMVVPFPPGGSSDIVARMISPKLSQDLGQPIVVDNKAGASGTTGAAGVARAEPDGYTLMVGSIGVLAINPSLYRNLSYDPGKNFDLLTMAVRTPNVLVVHPSFPVSSVAEFVDRLKKSPASVTFASSSVGASDHLTTELFFQRSGTSGLNVTYKGSAPAITDLLGGHVSASFRNLGEVAAHIRDGKMRLLAVTADKRIPEFPDTPTMAEAGVAGVDVFSWQGIAAPKGLPADVLGRLQPAIVTALKDPEVTRRLNDLGFEVVGNSREEFARFQAAEQARWKSVVEVGKITVE